MRAFEVIHPVRHNDQRHLPGEVFGLPDDSAAPLLALGAIRPAAPPAPQSPAPAPHGVATKNARAPKRKPAA